MIKLTVCLRQAQGLRGLLGTALVAVVWIIELTVWMMVLTASVIEFILSKAKAKISEVSHKYDKIMCAHHKQQTAFTAYYKMI